MLYLTFFIFAFLFTVLFTPLSILLARKFNVLDYPKARKVHSKPLPRWGGIGIYFGFISALWLVYAIFPEFKELLSYTFESLHLFKQLLGIFFGGTVVFILGLIDDRNSVRSVTKLLIQIIAAYIAMDYGVRMLGLAVPFFGKYYDFPIILGVMRIIDTN